MSLSEEEQKKAVSVVISKLRQKDLPGLLAAQRAGKLDEFVSPHLDAYIAKNYSKAGHSSPSPSTPNTNGVAKEVASAEKRDLKRTPSMKRAASFKRSSSVRSIATVKNQDTAENASAMEEGCNVWVRPDRTDNWVKAKIVSVAKHNPPVSAYRKPDPNAAKQSVFVLDLQDDNDSIIGQIEIISSPMPESLEEFETVKLRNPEGDQMNGVENQASHTHDLTSLSYLHEPAIMYCLQQRFEVDKIYTSTGPILLAVNPFKSLDIYSEKTVVKYRDVGAKARFNPDMAKKLPPHPYQIADNAYRNMVSNALLNKSLLRSNPHSEVGLVAQNQSILVSGESGAGKTETTKFIMRYLADITKDDRISSSQSIENQVLQSNPVLECFGNARTLRNDNSSRFGKFIEINFSFGDKNDEIFRITGATIRTYLLEKVRLVRQAYGERNYHVFYELVNGYDRAQLNELGISNLNDFHYTNQSSMLERLDGVKDKDQFQKTVQALSVLGIDNEEQASIWKIIAALMHVGNITFDVKAGGPGGEDDGSKISPSCQHHVESCCSLLGLNENDFVKAMCVQKLVIPDKVLEKMVSTSGAEHNRDVFSKSLYGALFDWLVQRINKTIASDKMAEAAKDNMLKSQGKGGHVNQCFIGVLDIFGFENFQMNSFEQLCINYTNETLQHHFNNFVFKHEQSLYEAEGIDWNFIKFPDNSDVLNLLEDRVVGVFAICDEQVRFPKATDITLIHKLYEKCSSHSRFFAGSKEKADNVFVVKHFAGPVKYSSASFLEKNSDLVRPELAVVANNSSMSFICELSEFFRIDDALLNKSNPLAVRKQSSRNITPAALKSVSSSSSNSSSRVSLHNRTKTLGAEFRGQMEELMANINTTSPHYIRCLKPNSNNVPNEYDCPLIVSQLRCGGVLEAVRVTRAGYSKKYSFDSFYRRYCFYVDIPYPSSQSFNQATSKFLASKIAVKALENGFVPSDDSLNQTDELLLMGIQVGRTSVFLRNHTFDFLERQKLLHHRNQAVKIQSHARRYNAETNYKDMKRATAKIQCAVRVYIAKQKTYRLKTFASVVKLQRVSRGYLARKRFRIMKTGFCRLQSVSRAAAERTKIKELKRLYRAAVIIQCFVRSRWAIRALKQLRIDARDVEKVKLVVDDLKMKLSESAGKWKAEKVAIIAEFKGEFQELTTSLLATEKELAIANNRIEVLTEDLKLATEDFQELDAEFGEYRENNPDKEYAEALEIDLSTVRDDLRLSRERAELLEKENTKLSELKAQHEKLQADIDELSALKAEQEALLKAKEAKIESLIKELDATSSEAKKAQSTIEEMEAMMKDLEVEKDSEISEKVDQLHSLEKELARCMSQLKDSQEKHQTSQAEVSQTMQSLREVVQNNRADLERFEEEKAKKIQSLNDVIAAMSGDLDDCRTEIDNLSKKLRDTEKAAERDTSALQTKLDSTVSSLEGKQRESDERLEKMKRLENELDSAAQQSDVLRRKVSDIEKEVKEQDKLTGSLRADIEELKGQLVASKKAIDNLTEEKRALEGEVQNKVNELNMKDELFALREQALESGSEELLKKIEEKQKELDDSEATRKGLETDLEKTRQELKSKVDELHEAEANFESEKSALEEKLSTAVSDLTTSQDEAKAVERALKKETSDLNEKLRSNETLMETLRSDLAGAQKKTESLQKDIDERDELVDSLEKNLRKSNESVEAIKAECDKASEEREELQVKLQEKENREKEIQSELDRMGQELEGEKKKVKELDEESQSAQRSLGSASKGVIDPNDGSVKSLQEELAKIQDKYVEKRAEVETLHIGLDSLLDEYKNSQSENDELVEILKSRDDMLLESVSVLEDRESALAQIKALESGVDNILQELKEVQREKDELQQCLDEALDQQSLLEKQNSELAASNQAKSDALRDAQSERNMAKAEAVALATKLQASEQQQHQLQRDVNDIKHVVEGLQQSLQKTAEENAMLRAREDEFKEADESSLHYNGLEKDIERCQHIADWLIEVVGLPTSKALQYSTMLVQDGKSSLKRVRKAVKRDSQFLNDLGVEEDDAKAITKAFNITYDETDRDSLPSSLFPITLSPSAPRQYTRAANGRLSLSPSVRLDKPAAAASHTPDFSSESHEEEKKEPPTSFSMSEKARLEEQAREAARKATAAAEEADRVAQRFSRRHSTDGTSHDMRKSKKQLREERDAVAKAQEKAYLAATKARDAFFLASME